MSQSCVYVIFDPEDPAGWQAHLEVASGRRVALVEEHASRELDEVMRWAGDRSPCVIVTVLGGLATGLGPARYWAGAGRKPSHARGLPKFEPSEFRTLTPTPLIDTSTPGREWLDILKANDLDCYDEVVIPDGPDRLSSYFPVAMWRFRDLDFQVEEQLQHMVSNFAGNLEWQLTFVVDRWVLAPAVAQAVVPGLGDPVDPNAFRASSELCAAAVEDFLELNRLLSRLISQEG